MNFDTYIVDTPEALEALFAYADTHTTPVVLDVETDNVQEKLAKLHGVGLCFKDGEAFYVPIRGQDRSLLWDTTQLDLFASSLLALCKRVGLIGHNAIYDILVLEYNFGYDLSEYLHTDTILLKHTIFEERPFGLKEVAVKYLGPWADKAQDAMKASIKANGGSCTKENMEMWKADIDILADYCCYDVILTRKLYDLFLPMLKKEGLEKFFYEEEVMPLYKEVVIDMKRQGVKIDVAYFEKLKHDITIDISTLEKTILDEVKDSIAPFENRLLEKDYPVSRKGSFPKVLADLLGVILPTNKAGNITLSKKETDKAAKEAGDDNSVMFFAWLSGEDCVPAELLRATQMRRFKQDNERDSVFNLKSGDHLAHLLFEVNKEKPLGTTETGKPQVDDELLEGLKEKYTWVAKLVDLKKLNKLSSTYIEGLLDRHIDGIIYTSFLQFGTTSGRFSSTAPNCQNLPATKEEDNGLTPLVVKYTNSIRAGFIAREGKKFIDNDYVALEAKCFAHMSNSPDLKAIFIRGEDMYSSIAIKTFKEKNVSSFKKDVNYLGKVKPELRKLSKVFCLATVYGAEAGRIADLMGSSREEAQEVITAYLDAYPELRNYINESHNNAKKLGYVQTIFGRKRHLPEVKAMYEKYGDKLLDYKFVNRNGLKDQRRMYKNGLNNATNMRIQGLAAHIINRAMIAISRKFKQEKVNANIVLQIHDQLVIECYDRDIPSAKKIVQNCMEETNTISVPLVAEPQVATNLKESH